MKKLLVVLAALLLVGGTAVTSFAAMPASISGEFDFSMMSTLSKETEGAEAGANFGNSYIDLLWNIDDINQIMIELSAEQQVAGQLTTTNTALFLIKSDVGKAFDLPVGLVARAGKTDLFTTKFEVTGHAWERVGRPRLAAGSAFGALATLGPAQVDVLAQLDGFGAIVTVPTLGPVWFQAAYINGTGIDGASGAIDVAVKYAGVEAIGLKVAGQFIYDLDDDVAPEVSDWRALNTGIAHSWAWGAGAAMKWKMFTFGASANGMSEDAFNKLGIEAEGKFNDKIGATAAAGFYFADGFDAFGGVDLSLFLTPGKSTWRVGYAITEQGYTYGSDIALLKGGLYAKAGIDF